MSAQTVDRRIYRNQSLQSLWNCDWSEKFHVNCMLDQTLFLGQSILRTIALNWTRFFAVRLYRKRWLGRKARPLVHKKWCRHTVAENDQQLFKTWFGKNQINRYFRGKASQNSLAVRSLRHELEKELLLEMYIYIVSCFFTTLFRDISWSWV